MTEAAEPRSAPRSPSEPVATRAYRDADEIEILKLLSLCLGPGPAGRRSSRFFRWKHLENPFGPSLLLLAESAGRIVGLRAFMRWGLHVGGRSVRAVRAALREIGPGEVKRRPKADSGADTKPPNGGAAFCSAGSSALRSTCSCDSACRSVIRAGSIPFSRSA